MATDYSKDSLTWLHWADYTYAGARTLFGSANPFLWFPAALLGHHALEMYLKGALIVSGHSVTPKDVWGHDLITLAKQLFGRRPMPRQLARNLRIFDSYFNELRYPSNLTRVEELGEAEGKLLRDLVRNLRSLAERTP